MGSITEKPRFRKCCIITRQFNMTILPLLFLFLQVSASSLQVPDLAPPVRQAARNTITELPILREGE